MICCSKGSALGANGNSTEERLVIRMTKRHDINKAARQSMIKHIIEHFGFGSRVFVWFSSAVRGEARCKISRSLGGAAVPDSVLTDLDPSVVPYLSVSS
jgi:hypothetical protein